MTALRAPVPRLRTVAWARGRWAGPLAQAVVLATVLTLDAGLVLAARADLRAEQGVGPRVPAAAVQESAALPVTLGVPDLEITTRLIGLRKNRAGALQVPEDAQRAGWYSQGPVPGDAGPAVIVGHVDSYRGPGIFHRLRTLKPGQQVKVRRSDGKLATFVIREVKEYGKRDFPTAKVYAGDGKATLRLVTCGGEFDRKSRSYRSNIVVFADLVRKA